MLPNAEMVPKECELNQSETDCGLWQRREMVNYKNVAYMSSRRHNSPSKLKLRNNQAVRNVNMWMQQ